MSTLSPAAKALIEALADPTIDAHQRAALASTLAEVMGQAAPAAVAAPLPVAAPARARWSATVKVERRAESIRFGKESVAVLPLPASGERYVYDTECPQLAVRLRPGGKTYMAIMWDSTRHRTIKATLGKTDKLTPEQARKQAQGLVANVGDGIDVRTQRGDGLKLGQLIEAWFAEKSKSSRTADEMRKKALDYLGALQGRPVAEVSREDIGRIHHIVSTTARRRVLRRVGGELRFVEVGKAGIPATADKWLAIMSSVYGWAAGKGLVTDNPCKGIKKSYNAKEASRTTYFHGDPLPRFWKALEADPDADVRDLLLLALYTGQRKGNVLTIRWDHVDIDARLWTIPASQTKQKKSQTNSLGSQAVEILARRHAGAGTPWVFPAVRSGPDGTVGCMSATRPRDAWERICKAADIEGMRIHDLRHTAGSWLARGGANTAIRQKALGHQTSAMAEKYAHLELDPVADAMQRMGDAITAAATKPKAEVQYIKEQSK